MRGRKENTNHVFEQTGTPDCCCRHRSHRRELSSVLPRTRVRRDRDGSSAKRRANLRHFIDTSWSTLATLGLSPKASPEHLWFTTDLSQALADVDFVQESTPDQRELKIKLFSDMDRATPRGSIIASSSAGLMMSVMQSDCAHPERCVVGHPLNPPHIIPLVEVVGGEKTSPETVQQAMSFYASIGRKPIHIRKEIVGHVANRLQAALYRELAFLIDQDVVDVAARRRCRLLGTRAALGSHGPPSAASSWRRRPWGIHRFMDGVPVPMATWWNNTRTQAQLETQANHHRWNAAGGRGPPARAARSRAGRRAAGTDPSAQKGRERQVNPPVTPVERQP